MSTELSKEKLQALAYTDELTRLHNLRYMREYLPQYLDTANEAKQNAALFVCDLDDFKLINDNHGHLAGDQALVHFTKIIEEKTKNKGEPSGPLAADCRSCHGVDQKEVQSAWNKIEFDKSLHFIHERSKTSNRFKHQSLTIAEPATTNIMPRPKRPII